VGKEPRRVKEAAEKLTEVADKALGKQKRGAAGDFLGGFGKALLVALLIRTVLIEPFRIPSGSMIPTLEIGDQIFVNKFIYGVRIPFTNYVPFRIVRKPERGDVIVFNNPVSPDKDFVKRIIGIPGDVVDVTDKVVHLNGKPVPTELENPGYRYMDERPHWQQMESMLVREKLDGTIHLAMRDQSDPTGMHEGPYTVPEGHVFVMGDNRDNSEDSRYGLGGGRQLGVQYVPYGNIKGKAMVIWISFSHGGLFSGLFGGTGLRTDRFFQPVGLCGTEPRR
jgi:signal peptidase I